MKSLRNKPVHQAGAIVFFITTMIVGTIVWVAVIAAVTWMAS